MKIETKDGPALVTPPNGKASTRERAIAALLGEKAPSAQAPHATQDSAPVPNPSKISPEEMGALTPSSQRQIDNTESPSDAIKAPESPEAKSTEEQSPLSQQYAVLARKEKALRAKVQAQEASIKAKEAAIAEREAAIKAKEAEYQSNYIPKNRLTEDTLGVLTEAGITYDQLTQLALNQTQTDPVAKAAIQKLESELKSIREAQDKAQKSIEDQQSNAYKQAVSQIRNEVKQLVTIDSSFEAIRATNSVDDVVDLIEQTFKDDGVLLSVEDAAREVEEYLAEEAFKLSQLKKIQSRLQPKQSQAPKQSEPKQESKQPQMKTLTNAVTSSRPLSPRERAILAFKGELK